MEELQSLHDLYGEERVKKPGSRLEVGLKLEMRVAQVLTERGYLVFQSHTLDHTYKIDMLVYGRKDGTYIRSAAIQISLSDSGSKVEIFRSAPRLKLRSKDCWRLYVHISVPDGLKLTPKKIAKRTVTALSAMLNEGHDANSSIMVRHHVRLSEQDNSIEYVPLRAPRRLSKEEKIQNLLNNIGNQDRSRSLALKSAAEEPLSRNDRLAILKSTAFNGFK